MKIKGKTIEGPGVEYVVIPRPDSEDIVFTCAAVLDFDDFEKLCPMLDPPMVLKPGGVQTPDVEDEGYKKMLDEHGRQRMHWLTLKSLEVTEGLEWETVDMQDPITWKNFEEELKHSGFSFMEVAHIRNGVMSVNSFDDRKMKEARDRVLAGLQQAQAK